MAEQLVVVSDALVEVVAEADEVLVPDPDDVVGDWVGVELLEVGDDGLDDDDVEALDVEGDGLDDDDVEALDVEGAVALVRVLAVVLGLRLADEALDPLSA
ncbi:MAG: hypothetical protein OK456_03205 [Thaumarchaeota archaeon]|nr:hypothetical protein [Nitrososphaerota archaeon]